MNTIPLDPLFKNNQFQGLNPTLKFFLVQAVYLLCKEDKASQPIPNNMRLHLQCSEATYFRNKDIFRAILIEVLPQIAQIKRVTVGRAKLCGQAMKEKAEAKRKEKFAGKLLDEGEANPAPITAQFSRESENLRRQRITNENEFTRQPTVTSTQFNPQRVTPPRQPARSTTRPALTEKPPPLV